jgi:hypothetical protein
LTSMPAWPKTSGCSATPAFFRSLWRGSSSLTASAKGGDDMSKPRISSDVAVVNPHDLDTVILPDRHAPLSVRCFGVTDAGKVRATNEDQFLIAVLLKALQVQQTSLPHPTAQHNHDRSYLFAVADGMGGHAGGEQASALAIDSVETFMLETFKWFFQIEGKEEDKLLAEFRSALGCAHARVLAEAAEHP